MQVQHKIAAAPSHSAMALGAIKPVSPVSANRSSAATVSEEVVYLGGCLINMASYISNTSMVKPTLNNASRQPKAPINKAIT